jgi:hypothetical protein
MVTPTRFLSADTLSAFLYQLAMYFGDTIESGVLRASYKFANIVQDLEESMVAGEISARSGSPRNSTVVAEYPSVLWTNRGTGPGEGVRLKRYVFESIFSEATYYPNDQPQNCIMISCFPPSPQEGDLCLVSW